MFTKGFQNYACDGDSITCDVQGFTITATLHHDDGADAPDQMSDGFWPSLNPKSAGYIGNKSQSTLRRHLAKAREVMRAWQQNEWFYCGVSVTVARRGVELVGRYDHALWGIECNYPGSGHNNYLTEVANELLGEALADARAKLATLCERAEA
jgi:hypothetical protein